MAKVRVLTLITEKQASFALCGPAAIRMMLSHFGLLYPQPSLWTDVQNNSNGTLQVNGVLPPLLFPKQVCDLCGIWFCWYTSPESMAKTLTQRGPITAAATTTYKISKNDAVSAQIDSLQRAIPYPAATIVLGSNHWVVVAGYHLNDPGYPGAPPILIGSRQVNGVHWADPADATHDPPMVQFIETAAWKNKLKSIDCGPHTNRFPNVVGTSPKVFTFKWMVYVVARLKQWPLWPWNRKQIERR